MSSIKTSIVKKNFEEFFASNSSLWEVDGAVFITDENIFNLHQQKFNGYKTIVIKAGEQFKQQAAVDYIIDELIGFEADRKTFIIGVGGGVVTDIAGYAASVYMRGLKFGFVPTSILAMVDASIGGKNGIDVGVYKNLVGLIKQPEFLLYDYAFLKTLPNEHWINGFAEIIKHACIKDANMFALLENHSLEEFKNDTNLLANLIDNNASIKLNIVEQDEFEQGDRKLLNFGHTVGHAIENMHLLLHGHAISIGMLVACKLSEKLNNFNPIFTNRIENLLNKYHLSTHLKTNADDVFKVLKMDKKRNQNTMNFILLNNIGDAIIKPIELNDLKILLNKILV